MRFYRKERGQGMVEYALLIVLLALVVIFMVEVMGNSVSTMYSHIKGGLDCAIFKICT